MYSHMMLQIPCQCNATTQFNFPIPSLVEFVTCTAMPCYIILSMSLAYSEHLRPQCEIDQFFVTSRKTRLFGSHLTNMLTAEYKKLPGFVFPSGKQG